MKFAISSLIACVLNIPFIVMDASRWWNWMSAIFCFGIFIMAWNPSPKVADCREIAKKWGKHQIIILAVNVDECTLEAVSFGTTKELCADAKRLADACYETIYQCYEEDIEK